MLLEVSLGEAIDKYSILEIKSQRIRDPRKRADVLMELERLGPLREIIANHTLLYTLLVHTNEVIWDLTDRVKGLSATDPNYASIANQIFDQNQSRFRIKSMLNYSSESTLKEQKSYAESEVSVAVTDLTLSVGAIWQMSLLYDVVYITGEYTNILKEMFTTPNFKFTPRQDAVLDTRIDVMSIVRHAPTPLRYVSGGRTGDLIHELSVIFEIFLRTGRKGILYLGERETGGDQFALGVVQTLTDISPVISAMPYIQSLEVYAGQSFDINLSSWRLVPDLYSKSWHEIFGESYGVEWAKHAWLSSVIRTDLANTTLVCSSPARWVTPIHWTEFVKTLPGKVMYLRVTSGDYDHFRQNSGIDLPCVDVANFTELVIAIHSCKKFVGTLSMPLAVADALKKDRLALTRIGTLDEAIAIKQNPNYINRYEPSSQ